MPIPNPNEPTTFTGSQTFQLCIYVFFLGVLAGGMLINFSAEFGSQVRQEAVKNGVAHYVADENGKPQFQWKKGE